MLSMLANHLWQSTLFAAVIGLLTLVFRNNGAHTRYWLWWIASLKFFIPFALLVALGRQIEWRAIDAAVPALAVPEQWSTFANAIAQPAAGFDNKAPTFVSSTLAGSSWNTQSILFAVWLCGFLGVLAAWFIRWMKLRTVLRNAKPLSHTVTDKTLDFPVPIKCTTGSIEPGIVGIFRPLLLLPQGLSERLTSQQLRAILAHELCHLRRRDNLTAAIHMLVEAIFWFHPLVWWIGARLIEERERACDAAVLGTGNDPETYAEGILDVCQHYVATPFDCVAGVSGADLKKRVRAVMNYRGEDKLHLVKQVLLIGLGLVGIASPVVIGVFTASRTEAQVTSDKSGVIDKDVPAFASVSLTISQSDSETNKSLLINANGFTTINWSVRGIISWAYGIQDSEIQELNASINDIASTHYHILATTAQTVKEGPEGRQQLKLMVRKLLVERFQMTFHWESTRAPVYMLSVGSSNSGLKTAKSGDPGPFLGRGINSIYGNAIQLLSLKQFLSDELHRPVLDQTGLNDTYNFKLKWAPEPGDPDAPADAATPRTLTTAMLVEALQQQLGLTLTSQDGDVQRMVIDRLQQPTGITPAHVEVKLTHEVFDRYVGYYDFPPGRTMKIARDGDRFSGQLTGQPAVQMYAASEREFFLKLVNAQLSFVVDDTGQTTELVLHQNGRDIHAPKISDAAATIQQDALAKRIRETIPMPGSEIALRKYFDGMQHGQPAYELMNQTVADAVRAQSSAAKERYKQLGQLKSISLTGVGPSGADIYSVEFENGTVEWRISLDRAGKIDNLNYRRMPSTQ
jgi:uncharacterized protein (TIGR03435 family)